MTENNDQKCLVLDTCVLMLDPEAILKFGDNEVIIPAVGIEELGRHTHGRDVDKSMSAQAACRVLNQLRAKGRLVEGVATPGGGTVKVDFNGQAAVHLQDGYNPLLPDNIILKTALRYKAMKPSKTVVLVTNDINLGIKAEGHGLLAEDYKSGNISPDRLYSGFQEVVVPDHILATLKHNGLPLAEAPVDPSSVIPNSCWMFIGAGNKKTALAIYKDGDKPSFHLVHRPKENVRGITPRNDQQTLGLALCMDPSIHLVTLFGKAGTGKSIIQTWAACNILWPEQVFNPAVRENDVPAENRPQKLLIIRPTVQIGEPLGFLPGDLDEKMAPWQEASEDTLDLIGCELKGSLDIARLILSKVIQIGPANFMRGGTKRGIIIVDDAQNFSPLVLQTILTRAGDHTRVFVNGDLGQIDVPTLGKYSNGLAHVISRFRGDSIFANLELVKGERSLLAEKAATLL